MRTKTNAREGQGLSAGRARPKWALGTILVLAGLLGFSGCLMYLPEVGPFGEPDRPFGRTMDTAYFYDYLSPYGAWHYWPAYGYVWVPFDAGYGWRPYADGCWVWTDYGWMWISYESWGWLVYHYGRWVFEPGFGWFWVPDTIWGPAWVAWRHGQSWIGWAPLPPRFRYAHRHGLALDRVDLADDCWVFVEVRHFTRDRLGLYALDRGENGRIVRRTTATVRIADRQGRPSNIGLAKDLVERLARTTIPTYGLEDDSRPGRPRVEAGRVVIHRPDVVSRPSAKPETYRIHEGAGRTAAAVRDPKRGPVREIVPSSGSSPVEPSRVSGTSPDSRKSAERTSIREVTSAPPRMSKASAPEAAKSFERSSVRTETMRESSRRDSGREASSREARARSDESGSRRAVERTDSSKAAKGRDKKDR